MLRRPSGVLAIGLAVIVGAIGGGCATSTGGASGRTAASSRPALRGPLTVLAAASLTEPFNDAKERLVAQNPRLSITYGFAGSQQLAAQVRDGAPADVIATADEETMGTLVDAGLVEAPQDFAANKLAIAVAPGNPKRIAGLADLARRGLKVVLGDPSVPVGRYAERALARARIVVRPASFELDVKSVVAKVASGEADAGVVYVTDVVAGRGAVGGVDIPDDQNVVVRYPVAVVKTTRRAAGARAFVAQLLAGPGQAALREHGFLSP